MSITTFEKSDLYADFGYTKGYRKETTKKTLGEKGHLFAKYIKLLKEVETLKTH